MLWSIKHDCLLLIGSIDIRYNPSKKPACHRSYLMKKKKKPAEMESISFKLTLSTQRTTRNQRTGFTEISSIHVLRSICSFLYFYVPFRSSLGWLCIHFHIVASFEKEREIFILSLGLSFPAVWHPVWKKSERIRPTGKLNSLLLNKVVLSPSSTYTYIMKFYCVLQTREREREEEKRKKDLKTSRHTHKKNERIKKVASVPSSNTLSLSSLSFSPLPTQKVA